MTASAALAIDAVLPDDRQALAATMAIMDAAFDPAFGEAWTLPQLRASLDVPGSVLLLARESEAVGFALVRTLVDEAELLLLAVSPARRRQGIGCQLLAAVDSTARALNARCLFLEVRDGNDALSLYLQNGFEAYHRRNDYYVGRDASRHDAISLRKNLGSI